MAVSIPDPPTISEPSELLPPPEVLRDRLAQAMRDVDILRGLLRLSEAVARRDGVVAKPPLGSRRPTPKGDGR